MKKIVRKTKTILAILLVSTLMFSFGTTSVSAADNVTGRMGPYQLSNGIGSVKYYITNSILNNSMGSTLVTLINNAANSWVNTGYGYNPLYMNRTYDLYSSNLDIYGSTQIIESFNRVDVSYWRGTSASSTRVTPLDSNWTYCEMILYVSMHDPNNYNKLQRSIAHGMGHTFGLDDNYNNSNSVMCDFYHECYVYKPGIMDHNGLNTIYG